MIHFHSRNKTPDYSSSNASLYLSCGEKSERKDHKKVEFKHSMPTTVHKGPFPWTFGFCFLHVNSCSQCTFERPHIAKHSRMDWEI